MEQRKKSNDKRRALSALGYFDEFSEKQLESACQLALLRQYKPLQIIYNEDRGPLTYVHFVLSGECMILQCLRMKVGFKRSREKIYKLEIIQKGNDDIFHKIDDSDLMRITERTINALHRKNKAIDSADLSKCKGNKNFVILENNINQHGFEESEDKSDEQEMWADTDKRLLETNFKNPETNIENHFIDVGTLSFGGIFGLGELLEHRVIMARTLVQCILLPRFWLFEKPNNPAGIWDRRRFYIECNIPSRQELYENFLTTRKWHKFKKQLIRGNLGEAFKNNPTKVQDIPIVSRIVESNSL